MKKLLKPVIVSTILVVALFCCVSAMSGISYEDASSWAVSELEKAAEYGFITDEFKGKLNEPITREEFAELAVKLYEKYTGKAVDARNTSAFNDTDNPEVSKAYSLGIVNGTNKFLKLFSPKEFITREQVAVMMYRTINAMNPDVDSSTAGAGTFADEREISGWALEPVRFMNKNGFLKGADGRINPKGTCTREMAILIATRVLDKYLAVEVGQEEPGPADSADSVGYHNLKQIVINDMEIFPGDYRIREKNGSDYIFIAADKIMYAFKRPYAGNYTYPEVDITGGNMSVSWNSGESVLLKVDLKEGSPEALVNGSAIDMGIAPYSEDGKLFVPINLFVAAMDMDIDVNGNGDIIFIYYKDDFSQDILLGKWANAEVDLFADVENIISGAVSLPTLVTAYEFKEDGSYGLRMASTGKSNDIFLIQKGKYRIMGNTIMFYDISETVYTGSPLKLSHEDKPLDSHQFAFIHNYDHVRNRIELGWLWLNKY